MEYLSVDDQIHLDRIKISHACIVFEAIELDRAYLRKWLPFVDQTRNKDDTERFIRHLIRDKNTTGSDVYTIWYKGEFAGLAGYKDTDAVNRKTEIGYWLVKRLQGKGIMIRTAGKLTDFAFRNLNLNRVQIKVAVGNHRSSAIPRKLGFDFEGIEREGEFHYTHFLDLEVYSFLRNDWVKKLQDRSRDSMSSLTGI
jgi:ribosomal-protein-serine acetyltransferase